MYLNTAQLCLQATRKTYIYEIVLFFKNKFIFEHLFSFHSNKYNEF